MGALRKNLWNWRCKHFLITSLNILQYVIIVMLICHLKSFNVFVIYMYLYFFRFTPIGVASLIATVLAKTDDLQGTFARLGMFILAAILGLVILMFVVIPLIFFIIIRRNPIPFFANLIRPFMITFATASSWVFMSVPHRSFVTPVLPTERYAA